MIGIIAAMEIEVNALRALLTNEEKLIKDNVNFYRGTLAEKQVVLVQSGIGKVNATISTTLLIKEFQPEYILNIGSCGALQEYIDLKDVVIANCVAFYDIDVPGWERSFTGEKVSLTSEMKLVSHAQNIIEAKAHFGAMVCGDSFIYRDQQVEEILRHFPEALACDMESGAILKTANHFSVPCLVTRGVSDNALKDDNHYTFDEYIAEASKSSAIFCKKFIESY